MATSKATTVEEYLASLTEERRAVLSVVRSKIRKHLPKGYVEGMEYGMIYYSIPLTRFPETYNGHPLCYAGLAAQKNHYAVYLMGAYGDGSNLATLKAGFEKAGKKLDMGKSCVRFKSLDDVALDAIGESIASMSVDDFIAMYERSRLMTKAGQNKVAAKKSPASTTKKTPSTKSTN